MGRNFLPYEKDQQYLLPPSIAEWVPEKSLARFVSEIIEHLDAKGGLKSFYEGYREDGWGRAAYHPQMMVKVLVYSYCVGVTSSRRIARAVEEDVSLRYLSANQQPDFRTVSDFRKDHLNALQGLFVDVLRLCQEAGLAKMGRVALDGRKVAGNAALEANRKKEAIEAEVGRILKEAGEVDEREDDLYGKDLRGDELPEGLGTKKDRLRRLREAAKRLEEAEEAAQAEQAEKVVKRREEEEKTGKGWTQGYNGQAAADCDSQVIVAQDVTQQENDVKQLKPMLERCEEQSGRKPRETVADAGYWSEDNAAEEGTELFIATTKDWKQRKALREKGPPQGRKPKEATPRDRMERKLLTKRGRAAYRQRGPTIEAVFGQMVMRGLRGFLMRGTGKVRTEWSLWCTTHNLLKLWRLGYTVQTT